VTARGSSPTEQPPWGKEGKEGNSPWCHPYIHESLAKHGTNLKRHVSAQKPLSGR
jgi:hypothetical protein